MKNAILPVLFSALLVPFLMIDAEASSKVVGKPCMTKYKSVTAKGKRWTAFAANEANKAGQACGWAMEFPARETAVGGAMSECRVSERNHPTWGRHGTCKIVFIK
jgi:hypothetical protein